MIDKASALILQDLRFADGLKFTELVRIARLDPAKDFRGADLRDVDFSSSDLSGYDFSGADLRGARFDQARIEQTIFTGASTEGATWPSDVRQQLLPWQERALRDILGELFEKQRGGLISLPAGFGRTFLIEKLIEALEPHPKYRNVLLVARTRAECEQFRHRLKQYLAGGSSTDTSDHLSIEILTTQRLKQMLSRETQATRDRLADVGLMIQVGEPHEVLAMSRRLPHDFEYMPILGFTSGFSNSHELRSERIWNELYTRVGRVLFSITSEDGVKFGYLIEVPVEVRQLESFSSTQPASLVMAARDVAYQISERFQSAVSIIICRDVEATQVVAQVLAESLTYNQKTPVIIHNGSMMQNVWNMLERDEAVVVLSKSSALTTTPSRLWSAGLIALLVDPGESLLSRIRFRPTRGEESRSVILDYHASFS